MNFKELAAKIPGPHKGTTASRYAALQEVARELAAWDNMDNLIRAILIVSLEHQYSVAFKLPPGGLRYACNADGDLAVQRSLFAALTRFGRYLDSARAEDWYDFVQAVLTHIVCLD